MSIIIKGMEMPKNCFDCIFEIHDEFELTYECPLLYKGYTNEVRTYKRLESCPIVCEVPEPHGRLIDADEPISLIDTRGKKVEVTVAHVIGKNRGIVKAIIPASEET